MNDKLRDDEGTAYSLVIVDDDDIARRAVHRALGKLGLGNRIECAADGLAAPESLECGAIPPPPLLLLDLSMPRLDGLGLLARLRRSDDPALRAVPVVIITTSTRGTELAACRALGAVPIEKGPGLAERIRQAITEALDR